MSLTDYLNYNATRRADNSHADRKVAKRRESQRPRDPSSPFTEGQIIAAELTLASYPETLTLVKP